MHRQTQNKTLVIEIGNICTEFLIPSAGLYSSLAARYKSFITKKHRKSCKITCILNTTMSAGGQKVTLTQDKNGDWHAYRRDFACRFSAVSGNLVLEPSLYAFDAFLRVFYATLLLDKNSLLIHASAFANKGCAFLFCGPSGTGKTTIAELARKSSRIINDEICAVSRDQSGRWFVGATPFWGGMGVQPATRKRYALMSIFFPLKSHSNEFKAALPATGVSRLLRCVCLFGKDQSQSAAALELCVQCINEVPCYDFYFTKQCDVVRETGKLGCNPTKKC